MRRRSTSLAALLTVAAATMLSACSGDAGFCVGDEEFCDESASPAASVGETVEIVNGAEVTLPAGYALAQEPTVDEARRVTTSFYTVDGELDDFPAVRTIYQADAVNSVEEEGDILETTIQMDGATELEEFDITWPGFDSTRGFTWVQTVGEEEISVMYVMGRLGDEMVAVGSYAVTGSPDVAETEAAVRSVQVP